MWSRPDQTAWRLDGFRRAAMLIDVQDYFAAAKAAMLKAQRSIHLLGWSFDPDARFSPEPGGGGPSADRFAALLKHLACNRPKVDVRLLVWKSALPVAASQNFFPHRARQAFHGTPVHFRLDGALPLGACHHQKMIIVDDKVAFVGGADIAPDRWDTTRHLDEDPRRISKRGKPFDSRHEVMMVVDGDAAASLGQLFRDRWERSSGQHLAQLDDPLADDPWPENVEPTFTDAQLAIARSMPAWRDFPERREVEALHLTAIAGAKRTIYMENQYFASPLFAEALAGRLEEPDGPEVVLVSTQHSPSWFDQMTMDRTRLAFLTRLKKADEAGRPGGGKLFAYCPVTAEGKVIIVHAKVTFIDDVMLRVGSANINNRSTGFDTECDVAIEARPGVAGGPTRTGIRRTRTDLLAHWLALPAVEVDEAISRTGGVGPAIEALDAGRSRRMRPLRPAPIGPLATLIADYHIGDPAGPGDSWRPWRRRAALETQLAVLSHRLEELGLPAPADELSPETV